MAKAGRKSANKHAAVKHMPLSPEWAERLRQLAQEREAVEHARKVLDRVLGAEMWGPSERPASPDPAAASGEPALMAPKAWLADVKKVYPKAAAERTAAYARRLYALAPASVKARWRTPGTVGRRLYDKQS